MKTSYNVTQPTEREFEIFHQLGQRIRIYREDRGITQKSLASSIGATAATVGTWEVGSPPRLLFLLRIADLFDLTLEELVFG